MNRNGIRPESLQDEPEPRMPEFVTAVGDDSITRFDNLERKKNKRRRKGNAGAGNDKPKQELKPVQKEEAKQEARHPEGENRGGNNAHYNRKHKPRTPKAAPKNEQ